MTRLLRFASGLSRAAVFQGIITSLGPEVGILKSEKHGELPFDVCENFSDTEFNGDDVQKEVEFTTIQVSVQTKRERAAERGRVLSIVLSPQVKSNTRAIRLRRTKKIEDPILYKQKKRDEEERKKEEEERKKRKEEKSKKREEEEECERELERKKKEEVAAALAAAKDKVRKELLGLLEALSSGCDVTFCSSFIAKKPTTANRGRPTPTAQ